MRSAYFSFYVMVLGSSFLAAGCSDDDAGDGAALGGSGGGSSGAAGAAAGAAGSAGTGAGGSAGAGAGGSAGTGAGGSGAGGTAGSGAAGAANGGAGGSAGAAPDAGAAPPDGGAVDSGPFTLSSPAFDNEAGCGPGPAADACDLFPVENTDLGDEGINTSPELAWTGVPEGTQSFAIVLHDLSAPFAHWALWNIPGTAAGLPENLPRGVMPGVPAASTQQVSYLGDDGFAGSGACGNVYELVLYALDEDTFTPSDAGNQTTVKNELDASDAVLETTTMRGRSNPDGPCDN